MKRGNNKIERLGALWLFAWMFVAANAAHVFGQIGKNNPCLLKVAQGEHGYRYDLIKTTTLCQKNFQAFADGARVVIGSTPVSDNDVLGWTLSIGENAQYKAGYAKGLSPYEAINFLKAELTADKNLRARVTGNIFFEAYGRAPIPLELVGYDSLLENGKSWYSKGVADEVLHMNKYPVERAKMIQTAYLAAFGRPANQNELQYWQPRVEHYKPLVEANRQYLYTQNGKGDLMTAIMLALSKKYGKTPNAQNIDQMYQDCVAHKKIFSEM